MKTSLKILTTILIIISVNLLAQGVAINEDGSDANSNAMLDIQSSIDGDGKGLLIPRITEAQRTTADASLDGGLLDGTGYLRGGAAQGLMVYQTDGTQGFYYNTSTTETPTWEYIGLETVPISKGGTGATTTDAAKTNLGLDNIKIVNSGENSELWMGDYNNGSGDNNISIGYNALASISGSGGIKGICGIAIGKSASARYAKGNDYDDDLPDYSLASIAIGPESEADFGGIAIGYDAHGKYHNIAIGHRASCTNRYNNIAIGNGVVNKINNTLCA